MSDELNNNTVLSISSYLKDKRNFNLKYLCPSLINRRLNRRLLELNIKSSKEYYNYLLDTDDEIDELINSLMINYSTFFRNSLLFEYIANIILPEILTQKDIGKGKSLRIWSVGCSSGEEPYSTAILINEFIQKNDIDFEFNLFATDIDTDSLTKAKKGTYSFEAVESVKYGLLQKYFKKDDGLFYLSDDIKNMVSFSKYDVFDKKGFSPPQSIFGDFDIVICRNLLIYYNQASQEKICDKLSCSISNNGYLILGKVEHLSNNIASYFKMENEYLHLYKKK
ncbi:MAG TPA: protein-glutamate O-methyltransferase CheR [Ignavibacteria bacterium]|nr:protein-glutamate O-methyltransferase CheR [Ignavibacteria bacterium]